MLLTREKVGESGRKGVGEKKKTFAFLNFLPDSSTPRLPNFFVHARFVIII